MEYKIFRQIFIIKFVLRKNVIILNYFESKFDLKNCQF